MSRSLCGSFSAGCNGAFTARWRVDFVPVEKSGKTRIDSQLRRNMDALVVSLHVRERLIAADRYRRDAKENLNRRKCRMGESSELSLQEDFYRRCNSRIMTIVLSNTLTNSSSLENCQKQFCNIMTCYVTCMYIYIFISDVQLSDVSNILMELHFITEIITSYNLKRHQSTGKCDSISISPFDS